MRIARTHREGTPVVIVDVDHNYTWHVTSTPLEQLLADTPPQLGDVIAPGEFLPPATPGNIIGIGLNYRDTVEQMGWPLPAVPFLFPKFPSSVIGQHTPILVDPTLTTRVDWEGELAVVIGRTAKHVDESEALDYVGGYTVANDISARDLQEEDGQWVRGKALDTFCPLGPWIVTTDRIPDPQQLRVQTIVDGETMQDGSTKDMVFGVAALIAYTSAHFTLNPGDVLLTGTPAGCGEWRTPPQHLNPGAVVEVVVEAIGSLSNPVALDPVQRRKRITD